MSNISLSEDNNEPPDPPNLKPPSENTEITPNNSSIPTTPGVDHAALIWKYVIIERTRADRLECELAQAQEEIKKLRNYIYSHPTTIGNKRSREEKSAVETTSNWLQLQPTKRVKSQHNANFYKEPTVNLLESICNKKDVVMQEVTNKQMQPTNTLHVSQVDTTKEPFENITGYFKIAKEYCTETVYDRIIKPLPTVFVYDMDVTNSSFGVEIQLIDDSGTDITSASTLSGNRWCPILPYSAAKKLKKAPLPSTNPIEPTGFACFKKIKAMKTTLQAGTRFRFRFVLHKYLPDGAISPVSTVAPFISPPFTVVSHSSQLSKHSKQPKAIGHNPINISFPKPPAVNLQLTQTV